MSHHIYITPCHVYITSYHIFITPHLIYMITINITPQHTISTTHQRVPKRKVFNGDSGFLEKREEVLFFVPTKIFYIFVMAVQGSWKKSFRISSWRFEVRILEILRLSFDLSRNLSQSHGSHLWLKSKLRLSYFCELHPRALKRNEKILLGSSKKNLWRFRASVRAPGEKRTKNKIVFGFYCVGFLKDTWVFKVLTYVEILANSHCSDFKTLLPHFFHQFATKRYDK